MCPKRTGERNPTWLLNEFTFAEIAAASKLQMPRLVPLRCNRELFLGSELIANRRCLKNASIIGELFANQNRVQLARALLLDLALLNSDRTHKNTLCDDSGSLWFVDHDKSLWGDGRPPTEFPKPGDLDRLNPKTLVGKFNDYLGDYLAFREANALVFTQQNHDLILGQFRTLRLDLGLLAKARAKLPVDWVADENFNKMVSFLPVWWERLQNFIEAKDSIERLTGILRDRERFGNP
jgi:hypothetical protein